MKLDESSPVELDLFASCPPPFTSGMKILEIELVSPSDGCTMYVREGELYGPHNGC
jgi:hypothetical protein